MNRAEPAPQRRREPTQKRSRKRVEQIVEAARALLFEHGIRAVTTTSIASKAGVPVGSVYQYFPDKSAILTTLYAEYLDRIQQVMLDWERNGPYEADWRDFFGRLHRRLKQAESAGNLEIDWLMVWQTHPELEALDRRHADVIAASTARMLRRYGSRWPEAKLRRLSLFYYRLNSASLVHRQQKLASAREIEQWGTTALMALLASCLPE